jgi:hypothetical protein
LAYEALAAGGWRGRDLGEPEPEQQVADVEPEASEGRVGPEGAESDAGEAEDQSGEDHATGFGVGERTPRPA